jgi:hypothetical protein
MKTKDNGMGPGKKPSKVATKSAANKIAQASGQRGPALAAGAATKALAAGAATKSVARKGNDYIERQVTNVTKKGDTTYTKYPKRDGMQVTKIMVTKMHPKDTTKKK